jgi:hypothetical protein
MKTLLIALLAAAVLVPAGSSASPTLAKKLPACKKGSNAKKCRCPAGQKLVKKGHKYRCQKKKPPQQQGQQGQQPSGDQGTTGTTDPPAGSGAQTERDDAGYTAALLAASRFGPRTDESNSGGIFTYTYDFCANGQFSHHSEYYNSALGQSESYYNGTWTLEQGFKVLQSTNGAKWAGILVINENDGSASRIEVDLNDSAAQLVVGNSAHLTGGLFSRAASVC